VYLPRQTSTSFRGSLSVPKQFATYWTNCETRVHKWRYPLVPYGTVTDYATRSRCSRDYVSQDRGGRAATIQTSSAVQPDSTYDLGAGKSTKAGTETTGEQTPRNGADACHPESDIIRTNPGRVEIPG
jgi:hypothetical protein